MACLTSLAILIPTPFHNLMAPFFPTQRQSQFLSLARFGLGALHRIGQGALLWAGSDPSMQ